VDPPTAPRHRGEAAYRGAKRLPHPLKYTTACLTRCGRLGYKRLHPESADMASRSLFNILTEQPWWVSLLATALVYSLGALFSPLIGAAAASPFFGMTVYVLYLRIRRGPTLDPAAFLKAVRAATPEELRAMLAEVYGRQGYEIADSDDGDLQLSRSGYMTLLRYRRWRAQSTGAPAVADLAQAMRRRQADRGIYVTAGSVNEGARKRADESDIALIDGPALVPLLGRTRGGRRALARAQAEAAKS
jgi:restriction system protein